MTRVHKTTSFKVRPPRKVRIGFTTIVRQVHRVQTNVDRRSSIRHFDRLNVSIFLNATRFMSQSVVRINRRQLAFGGTIVTAKTHTRIPSIPKLTRTKYLAGRAIFSLARLPPHLTMVNNNPVNYRLTRTFRQLNDRIDLLRRRNRLLGQRRTRTTRVVRRQFHRRGVGLLLSIRLSQIRAAPANGHLCCHRGKASTRARSVSMSRVLVKTKQIPGIGNLGLRTINISCSTHRKIVIGSCLRAAGPHVFTTNSVYVS